MQFSGAVLAGGASTRMGADKAFITVDGRPLVQIAADALRDGGAAEIFVVGGNAARLGELGMRYVADQFPGDGPLGAIVTALDAATSDVVAIVACDHPGTAAPAIRLIVGAIGDADVAIPVVDGHQQLMHAAWRRSARHHLRSRFAGGARSVREAIGELAIAQLLDGDPCWFNDVDTPADLRAVPNAGDSPPKD